MADSRVGTRLYLRLDPERRKMVAELAAERGENISQTIRHAIDLAYDEFVATGCSAEDSSDKTGQGPGQGPEDVEATES
jgi:hypothetical protein